MYCKKKKINYIDIADILNNELHEEALLESKRLVDNLQYNKFMSELMRVRYKGIIRKFFNSSFFVYFLINKIKEKHNINAIYVSGWSSVNFKNVKENFFISKICIELFDSKLVKIVSSDGFKYATQKKYRYNLIDKVNLPANSILVTNLGYNFKRIVFCAFKTKFKIVCLSFEKISKIKKFIFYILGVNIYQFKESEFDQIDTGIIIPDIYYSYKQKDFSKLLNFRKSQILTELFNLESQCKAISHFFMKNRPALILLNMVRGYNGYCAEISRKLNIPSLCVSHGTISKSFNLHGSIYQNIIAEEVFSGKAKYYALQTKITKNSLTTVKISEETIETGNIIFSEAKQKSKKYILYAVTNREFVNMHYFGIETYYEFLKNLDLFEKMAKKYNLNFLIKIHPGINSSIQDLRFLYKNLKFTKMKIEKALEISAVTISYSSTVIEDSLCSKVPVILFDQWKRYLHCEAQKDTSLENYAVYYATTENDLLKAINSVKESASINFKDYIYEGSYTENIYKHIFHLRND